MPINIASTPTEFPDVYMFNYSFTCLLSYDHGMWNKHCLDHLAPVDGHCKQSAGFVFVMAIHGITCGLASGSCISIKGESLHAAAACSNLQ